MEIIKQIDTSNLRVDNIRKVILKALEGKFLNSTIYLVILFLILSLSLSPEQTKSQNITEPCDKNELEIYQGEELLPPEITVEEIQNLYQLVCTYTNGGDKFKEGDVLLAIEDLDALPAQSGEGDTAYSAVYETSKGNSGVVDIASKAYGLPHNPPIWLMVFVHEFDHLFDGKHGAEWELIEKLRIHYVEQGVRTGVFDTYWWEVILQYASAHNCNVPVLNGFDLASEVCEKAVAIIDEQ